jgi:hypothetical protein
MQSYETKTFGKLSRHPISLQTLNGKKLWGFSVNAALVKGLRRIPFTDESRVRFPYAVQSQIFDHSTNYNPLTSKGWRFFISIMKEKWPFL